MNHKIKKDRVPSKPSISQPVTPVSKNSAADPQWKQLLRNIETQLASGNAAAAYAMLNVNNSSMEFQNARAVCLMQLERFADALEIYRGFVFERGTPCLKPELPIHIKTNFATCLLLNQHIAGCYTLINELSRDQYTAIVRLRKAISAWEKKLTFGQWFNWRLGGIAPRGSTVPYDGVRGTIFEETAVAPLAA
jgi:hypothetical protein